MSNEQHTTNWPDLAIGLYDRLTGRNAEISYEFDDLHLNPDYSRILEIRYCAIA